MGEEQLRLIGADQLVALYGNADRGAERPASPLLPADIAAALHQIPTNYLSQLLRHPGGHAPFIRAGSQGGSRTARSPVQPDAGAAEEIDFNPAGIQIRISAPTAVRAGALRWAEVGAWLKPGLTPTRRQALDIAEQALARGRLFAARHALKAHRQPLRDAIAELERIVATTVESIVDDALRTHQPGDNPVRGMPELDEAAVRRINEFLAALPEEAPADTGSKTHTSTSELPSVESHAEPSRPRAIHGGGPSDTEDAELDRSFAGVLDALTEHAQPATPDVGGDAFADIKAAFAQLREALDLPAADSAGLASTPPASADPDLHSLLDFRDAIAEAHACAAWYEGAPEWQRITKVTDAARALMTAIRVAACDYWAEVRRDIRLRGFTRTLAARVTRTVATTADALARSLHENGRGHTLPWEAAKRLHVAAAGCAVRVMAYPGAGHGDRMAAVADIIADLGRPHEPLQSRGPVHAQAGLRRCPNAITDVLHPARASFPRPAAGESPSPNRLVIRPWTGRHPCKPSRLVARQRR